MDKKFTRKQYDVHTKNRIIAAVRSGKPVNEVCREEKIQPYQVYAWIGERSLEEGYLAPPAVPPALTPDAYEELALAIGQWYIRTHLKGSKP